MVASQKKPSEDEPYLEEEIDDPKNYHRNIEKNISWRRIIFWRWMIDPNSDDINTELNLLKSNHHSSLFSSDSEESNDPFKDYNNRVSKSFQEKSSFVEDIDDHNYDDSDVENKSVQKIIFRRINWCKCSSLEREQCESNHSSK